MVTSYDCKVNRAAGEVITKSSSADHLIVSDFSSFVLQPVKTDVSQTV